MDCACQHHTPTPDENEVPLDSGSQALADALRISFSLLRWAMLLVLIAYLGSGLFVVDQHEKALVLMFGKVQGSPGKRVLGPGFHWTLPKPISEIIRIPAGRVQTLDSSAFWYARSAQEQLSASDETPPPTLDPLKNGYTLSGDANLVHSRWALRYTVNDPEAFLFNHTDTLHLLQQTLDHCVVQTSAGYSIDRLLRTDIESFRASVAQQLRTELAKRNCGVQLEGLDVVELAPPRQVEDAFNAVVEAEQEQSRMVSDARRYAGTTLSAARGDAARLQSEGEAYRRRLVSDVSAQADYFDTIYKQYQTHPRITARTLQQDTIRRVLLGVKEKFYLHENGGGERELRLNIGAKPKKKDWSL